MILGHHYQSLKSIAVGSRLSADILEDLALINYELAIPRRLLINLLLLLLML